MRSQSGIALMAAAVILSFAMPAIGATLLVLATALISRRRVVGILAGVAIIWIIGAFYYTLALSLIQKGLILIVAGLIVGLPATLAHGDRSVPNASAPAPHAVTVVRALAAIGLLMVGYKSFDAIRAKELLIRDGKPVFVELAPVDPRSLMQGDYMVLRFQLPREALRHQAIHQGNVRAIGKSDEKGVTRLTRIGDKTTVLEPGEIAIELSWKRGQWMLVTDAWFFKEGTAKKWEAARYGELRVMPDGSALLVGLADKDLVAIRK